MERLFIQEPRNNFFVKKTFSFRLLDDVDCIRLEFVPGFDKHSFPRSGLLQEFHFKIQIKKLPLKSGKSQFKQINEVWQIQS